MAANLAFKAIAYGAQRIPDKAFESIPGVGHYFTPQEKKDIKKGRKKREDAHRSKDGQRRPSRTQSNSPDRHSRRSSADYSDIDSEREDRRHGRHRHRRRWSRSISRSLSRSRDKRQARQDQIAQEEEETMGRTDRGEQHAHFSPPPTGEYAPRPYNPADYPSPPAAPAVPVAAVAGAAVGNEYYPPPAGGNEYYPPPPQPSYSPAYASSPALRPGSVSQSAAKYTPAAYTPPQSATYAPSPTGYAPYNPAEYAAQQPTSVAPGNKYPSPPPFYRQPSFSQPSLDHHEDQLTIAGVPSRHDSGRSSHRHKRRSGGHSHRTRSVGSGRSRSRMTDQVRDRLDRLNLDSEDKKLAAGAVGALAGGIAGNQVHHGTLSTLVGMAIGGLGGATLEKRHEK
ncbi:uncharacterized protein BDZ99DRAFT_462645 [Mytilinidion resinicola]|uniref:Glycine zipper 2TM domain-containing protein n=1 Tax=Mytilinidion resinicola TaxID=574789 RepID=A0A6A6YMD1_9PEZI|nr:uncharacterized protein BDZ99DRAFT_462645 [Mytilinidion resinicola]KAF2810032.1 hypothetical protein BDZ99DRAFT_462645 [Mytilinidion resinicola]